jgi:hypothetical protein
MIAVSSISTLGFESSSIVGKILEEDNLALKLFRVVAR